MLCRRSVCPRRFTSTSATHDHTIYYSPRLIDPIPPPTTHRHPQGAMAAATTAGAGVLLEGEAGKSGRHIALHPVSRLPSLPFRLTLGPQAKLSPYPRHPHPPRWTPSRRALLTDVHTHIHSFIHSPCHTHTAGARDDLRPLHARQGRGVAAARGLAHPRHPLRGPGRVSRKKERRGKEADV